jgi:hypothetical protein
MIAIRKFEPEFQSFDAQSSAFIRGKKFTARGMR